MKNTILLNIFINTVIAALLVEVNIWSLKNGFEESFVVFTIIFGIVFITANALFVLFKK